LLGLYFYRYYYENVVPGYCTSRSDIKVVCSQIRVETPLYTLIRGQSIHQFISDGNFTSLGSSDSRPADVFVCVSLCVR